MTAQVLHNPSKPRSENTSLAGWNPDSKPSNVSNITCLRHRDIRVCRLHEKCPSATHRRNPFRAQVKRASAPISTFRMYPKNQISGGREIAISKAALRLAQWIVPIACSEMDDSRSSQRACGTRSGHVGFSTVTSANVGSQFNFFYCPISCLHLCLLNFKLLSHFVNRRYFYPLRHLQIGLHLVFTTVSVKTPPSLFELS
jgi:hypothetical protein